MTSRRFKWTAAGSAVAIISLGLVGYSLIAAQGQGVLAQKPLNNGVDTAPAFIMAVDDSGSMTFQTQFPGMDGEGCWNESAKSFFTSTGAVNTASGSGNKCDYFHVLPGPRIDNGYLGIPQIDTLGFARSSEYNPTFFNPSVKYEPWIQPGGAAYGPAATGNTKIDPRRTDTVALASDYFGTSSTDRTTMQNGMVIPKGTTYRYGGRDYTANADVTWGDGTQIVYFKYWPATFYTKFISGNDDPWPQMEGAAGVYDAVTRAKIDNACGKNCAMWKYTIAASDSAALQNFANWFSYYGNRNRAMIAGMTRSLVDVNNLRVGYFRINEYTSYNDATKRLTMRDLALSDQKKALFTDMIALTAAGGTPNRHAVNAAALQFTRTDDGAPVKLSCQKNAVMLFTDGFSNNGTPSSEDIDKDMGIPFKDSNKGTMADIVSKYYLNANGASPLRKDLPAGQVPVPTACSGSSPDKRLDCQANLHLNFYGVTLGARGNLFNPDLVQDPYTDASIYEKWPASSDNDRSTVDDIWHATVNTRGEYVNARTPAEITTAMRRVLSAVTAGASPSGGTGANGARIGAGSISVGPSYEITNEGTDWFGRLSASKLSVDPATRAVVQTPYWEASAQLQSAASRNIVFTMDKTTADFKGGNLTLLDLCTKPSGLYPGMSRCDSDKLKKLNTDVNAAVEYLRGDQSGEVRNGGRFRDRTTRLGDIVTSTPFVSAPVDDYGYRRFTDAMGTAYTAYLEEKRRIGRYMVYVGANDGMLHAFNGGMDASGNNVAGGGTEAFAYIPSTAIGHMGNLLFPYNIADKQDQIFNHRYFVDGQIAVGDTYYDSKWRTTLVAASGAGGRSVFALDVTPGSSFSKDSKLWEISDLNSALDKTVRENIGHVLAKPVIVPVMEGTTRKWKAIFGNGFNSASGKAVLFIVDVASGDIKMVEAVEDATGVPAGANGLGSIVVIDRWGGADQKLRQRDGLSDTVYATDQKGAVWKFDLRDPVKQTVPLFTSLPYTEGGQTLRQPITGGINAGTGPNGGVMLYFGTGSFSFVEDAKDNSRQSLYAVNDTSPGPVTATVTRSNLTGRTVTTTGTQRSLTLNSGSPSNPRGWFIDLPLGVGKEQGSERFVANPALSNGVLVMNTYAPESGGVGCSSSGANWLFALYPVSGEGALGRATLNSPTGSGFVVGTAAIKNTGKNSGPVLNSNPFALPRVPPAKLGDGGGGGGGGGAILDPPDPPGAYCVAGVPNGPDTVYFKYPCGRQSWRQIQ